MDSKEKGIKGSENSEGFEAFSCNARVARRE